jgi:hypothetical protein
MSLASWQSDNFDLLKNRRVIDLILPGTHDSGAYEGKFDFSLPAVVYPQQIIKFIHNFPVYWNFFEKWSACQDKNFYEQLKSGIREFDMRFCLASDNKWRLHHSFVTETIDDVIEQFERFFSENPNEVVIWRVSNGGCPKNKYKGWVSFIRNKTNFNEKIFRAVSKSRAPGYSCYAKWCTYQNMIDENRNIYIITDREVNTSWTEESKNIKSAEISAEKWVKGLRRDNDANIFSCNITPSVSTYVHGFLCYGYPIIFLICAIIIAWRLYVIFTSKKSYLWPDKRSSIMKIIADIGIIFILIFMWIFIGGCTYTNSFLGIKGSATGYQNRMINVLKKNKYYIRYITSVSMDFPTDESIRWVINQNFQQNRY